MPELKFPYGREKLNLELPADRLNGTLFSSAHEYETNKSESEIVKEAMANPIASPKLKELAKGKDKIVIISSDHTRPVPSHITMPILLEEIESVIGKQKSQS